VKASTSQHGRLLRGQAEPSHHPGRTYWFQAISEKVAPPPLQSLPAYPLRPKTVSFNLNATKQRIEQAAAWR
jgi:hypothetical protein